MRILMILDHYFPPDTRVENEATALVEHGFEIHILTYKKRKQDSSFFIHEGIKVHRFYRSSFWISKFRPLIGSVIDIYTMFWVKKITYCAQKENVDFLHVHDLYMAIPSLKANKILQKKTILDLHENYPSAILSYNWVKGFFRRIIIKPYKWHNLEKEILQDVNKIIVLSNEYKNKLLNRYSFLSDQRFIVYPNVPKIHKFLKYSIEKNLIEKKDKYIVLYFGMIAERRGIFTCLQALKMIMNLRNDIVFLFIGPVDKSDKKKFTKLTNDETIKDNIIHFDWRDISLLPSYICLSDVCISPLIKNEQHNSGIANKVYQYMLFGKPVLASDCEPQKNLIERTNSGIVFESDNPKDLQTKLFKLIHNHSLREKLGNNGKEAIFQEYNWKEKIKNLVFEYRKISS